MLWMTQLTLFNHQSFIMQKKLLFLVQLVLSMSLCLPARVMAQSGNTVLQPQFGKQTVTVETGQEITFYVP